MAKKWTEEEENFLLENMNEKVEVLAEQLSRSVGAVKSRIRRFRTIIVEIDEPEMDDEKEVRESVIEYANELKEQVEEDVMEESNAIILDDIGVDIPVKAPEKSVTRFTWVLLLAAGLGLVLYGAYY
tara:strand:+ start:1744 stop:2124 length:381 start_codon:yes stop_codon:yes gene_type:complete